jgi:chorismate mutase
MENETIEELQQQVHQSENRLFSMCMELIKERCDLKLQVADLKHQLAMARVEMLGKEHDEC